MPDYAKMYRTLFRSQTKAIEILQAAQQETEEMYLSSTEPDIRVLSKPDDSSVPRLSELDYDAVNKDLEAKK